MAGSGQQVHPRLQSRRRGRRRGDRGGQRARRARPPRRRPPFLARPTSPPCRTPRTRAQSRSTSGLRKLERVVFHEKLGTQGERVERIEALGEEIAPRVACRSCARGARGPSRQGRSRDRNGRRIPRAAGPDGPLLRERAGRGAERRRRRSRSTTSRRGRTTAFRPRRFRSPSRSPTSSTRSPASGRSTRSRPAARTPMR